MASLFYPTHQELISSERDVILELRRSPRSMLGLLCWAAISALLVGVFCYFWEHLSTYLLFLLPIGLSIEAFRRYHDDLYLFERDQIIHKGGRFSLQYSVPSVRYVDIRAIAVNQSFFGRIFDYGDVDVNTAALDDGELYIEGVRAPDELAQLIEQVRRYREKIEHSS